MKITHHPKPESLMSCSAGSMPEAFAAVMASHIEMCPTCRKELAWLEHVGAALVESLPAAPVTRPAPVIEMRAGEALEEINVDLARRAGDVPGPLVQAVGHDLDTVPWTLVSSGVWQHQIPLQACGDSNLRLAKITPGQKLPELCNGGSSFILILRGGCKDDSTHYHVGDVADLSCETERSPVADPHHGCICLIATDGETSWTREGAYNKG